MKYEAVREDLELDSTQSGALADFGRAEMET